MDINIANDCIKNIVRLNNLITENPGLPVIVATAVNPDGEYGCYYGTIGYSEVIDIILGNERVWTKDDVCALRTFNINDITDDDCQALSDILSIDAYDLTDDQIIEAAKKLNWSLVIRVYINSDLSEKEFKSYLQIT